MIREEGYKKHFFTSKSEFKSVVDKECQQLYLLIIFNYKNLDVQKR